MSPTLRRPCPGCRVALIASPARRCPTCQRAYNAARPSRRVKGRYDRTFTNLRPLVFERDGGVCVYCARPATVVDHVVALVDGGQNEMSNLVACCASCNRRRATR